MPKRYDLAALPEYKHEGVHKVRREIMHKDDNLILSEDDLITWKCLFRRWSGNWKIICELNRQGMLTGIDIINQIPKDYFGINKKFFICKGNNLTAGKFWEAKKQPQYFLLPNVIKVEEEIPSIVRGYASSINIDKISTASANKENKAIDELQAVLQEKDTRIAELEAALIALQRNRKDRQSGNRTDAATNARLRKTIQDWKDSLTAMVKVALQCGEKGEKERTENEIKAMFEKNGDAINQAQLIEFKKALGPKHAKHSAGAPKQ